MKVGMNVFMKYEKEWSFEKSRFLQSFLSKQ